MKTRRRTGDPRGSALILAILIMLAMLGLGLMAMRTTTHAMAATGNIRLARQARLVAETGIYHVATVMNRGGLAYLQRCGDLRAPGEVVRIRFNSDGTVQYFRGTQTVAENVGAVTGTTSPVPAFLVADANRPSALGTFADGAGLVPSYFVELDGFSVLDPVGGPSCEGNPALCPKDCLVEFTATGFLARVALPGDAVFNDRNVTDQFAQQTIKAVLRVPVSAGDLCQK